MVLLAYLIILNRVYKMIGFASIAFSTSKSSFGCDGER